MLQKNVAKVAAQSSYCLQMEGKELKNTIQGAKDAYFGAAEAALAKKGLNDTSAEGLRKLLANGKKARKNEVKKAAS